MSRFSNARTSAGTAKKTASSKKTDEVAIRDLRELAVVTAAIKNLEALKSTLAESVNEQITDRFVATHKGSRPKNFKGLDTDATASCQLRKRSSRSNLSENDMELLRRVGVSMEESESTMFFINREYAHDADLLERISAAIDSVEGAPEDFILSTPEKFVTTDKSLDEAFAAGLSGDALRSVLKVVGTVASRTKFSGDVASAIAELLKDAG